MTYSTWNCSNSSPRHPTPPPSIPRCTLLHLFPTSPSPPPAPRSNKVKAGGLTWSYRISEPDPAKASPDKPDVLLLHGLGSSSYSFR